MFLERLLRGSENTTGHRRADPLRGAQVLVKDSVGTSWQLDLAFNEHALFSTEALASIEFSTDIDGRALNPPVRSLMASASDPPDSGSAGQPGRRRGTTGLQRQAAHRRSGQRRSRVADRPVDTSWIYRGVVA
jgi:hypothetical protein